MEESKLEKECRVEMEVSQRVGIKRDQYDPRDYIFEDEHLVMSTFMPNKYNILDKCPPVSNQGNQGSCLGHSASTCRVILEDDSTLDLSKAFLYFEARLLEGNENRDVGATVRSVCKVLKNMGVCTEDSFKYNEKIYDKIPSIEVLEEAKKYRVKRYNRITTIEGIKSSLYQYRQGILFGMRTYQSFYSDKTAKKGIVSIPSRNEKFMGDHSSVVIGYENSNWKDKIIHFFNRKHSNKGYFLCKNSYGENWGLPEFKGYFLLPYDYFDCDQKNMYDLWVLEK